MLANTLTLDDEEAVQEELRAIQEGIIEKTTTQIKLPSVPIDEPIQSIKEGGIEFRSLFKSSKALY